MRQHYSTELIAGILAGSWRGSPPPVELSCEELDAITPSLLETGAGGLAWWRVRLSSLSNSQSADKLHQAYRLNTLHSARAIRDSAQVFRLLRRNGVEPILVKGAVVSSMYPDLGMRPGGDIDLCVAPSDYRRADTLVKSEVARIYFVDLHRGFFNLDPGGWDDIYGRSVALGLDGTDVRVPCPEDHLRMLCFHFLREGAWRPLWLCDIAVALESRPAEFNWDLFLGGNQKRAKWFACTILLAHYLLHATLDDVPTTITATTVPTWFISAVLRAWEKRSMQRRHLTPMSRAWRRPAYALKGMGNHWPNAIEGTIGVGGPFNELPRLPFQIGQSFVRTFDYLRGLSRALGPK